jgi:hypothetical protein
MNAIKDLIGKTLESVKVSSYEIYFNFTDGSKYKMYHDQDCCEEVYIEDINGDLKDLIGSPLTEAQERSSHGEPSKSEYDDSWTWTYYTLATVKANVSIRWYGTSNGYYSESVELVKIN